MGNVEDRNVKISARVRIVRRADYRIMRTLYLKHIRSGYDIPLISVKFHMCGNPAQQG
jgi:hypothetical protein